ncbi:MAG: class I SAM-dependent methyltransferase [Pseudomonadota bacterium]
MNGKPVAAGKSSFDLLDAERFFNELGPIKGSVLLDAACGAGNYTLAAAGRMGGSGLIHAVDLWREGIESLDAQIARRKIANIRTHVADITKKIPLDDDAVDICLMATVLHDLVEEKTHEGSLREIKRVIRPGGLFAVVEFNKTGGRPGPPVHVKLSPEELDAVVAPFGFQIVKTAQIGDDNYMSVFCKP